MAAFLAIIACAGALGLIGALVTIRIMRQGDDIVIQRGRPR